MCVMSVPFFAMQLSRLEINTVFLPHFIVCRDDLWQKDNMYFASVYINYVCWLLFYCGENVHTSCTR